MHKMELESFIKQSHPHGLSYYEAAQLCLRMYCTAEDVPVELQPKCNKDNLAEAFSSLAKMGFINSESLEASLFGANYHKVTEKGHWVEVIASIYKNKCNITNNPK